MYVIPPQIENKVANTFLIISLCHSVEEIIAVPNFVLFSLQLYDWSQYLI